MASEIQCKTFRQNVLKIPISESIGIPAEVSQVNSLQMRCNLYNSRYDLRNLLLLYNKC